MEKSREESFNLSSLTPANSTHGFEASGQEWWDPKGCSLTHGANDEEALQSNSPIFGQLLNDGIPNNLLEQHHEPPRLPQGNRRGLGVSADVPDENEPANYQRVFIPKDDDAKIFLKQAIYQKFPLLDFVEQKAIFDAMFPVEKKEGEIIIEQGKEGDNFYVIESGEVDCFVNGEFVLSVKEGEFFGELDLIYGTFVASTTAFAKTPKVKLWTIDKQKYEALMGLCNVKKPESLGFFRSKLAGVISVKNRLMRILWTIGGMILKI